MDVTTAISAWPVSVAPARSSGRRAEMTRFVPKLAFADSEVAPEAVEEPVG
jgi:hypothetical protein